MTENYTVHQATRRGRNRPQKRKKFSFEADLLDDPTIVDVMEKYNLNPDEIADIYGISRRTVYTWIEIAKDPKKKPNSVARLALHSMYWEIGYTYNA